METSVQTCYRHPDRQAGVICQRCDRPICPSCMHQASVGFHCPECTKAGGQKVYQGIAAIAGRPVLTETIIGINLAIYVIMIALEGTSAIYGQGGINQFQIDFGLSAWFIWDDELYRLVTSGFLHSGLAHIAMNMIVLWIFGQVVERMATRPQWVATYLGALVAGSLGALVVEPGGLTLGASGAILGMAGAAMVGQRAQGVPIGSSPLLALVVLGIIVSFQPGVSLGGHLGGLVGGAVYGWIFFDYGARRTTHRWVPWILAAMVAVAVVVLSVIAADSWVQEQLVQQFN